jgi:hypothetical protein
MSTRIQWLAIAAFIIAAGSTTPAHAKCENMHTMCLFASKCIFLNDHDAVSHFTRIREGVQKHDGGEIWGELQGCTGNGGTLDNEGGKSCSPDDYVALGSVALNVHSGNQHACDTVQP